MADDRMKNDDRERNMGGTGQNKENYGQQTPGRKQQDDMSTGQRGAGQKNQPGHPNPMKDDDEFGTSHKSGTGQQGGRQGGQNR